MADKKISELVSLAGKDVAATDFFPVVDVSVAETKSLTRDELRNAVNAIHFTATKALATLAAASLPDDTIIEVAADESLSGARTRYAVAAGALVFDYGVVTKADLADTSDPAKGAALVGFLPAGTGAVARNVRDKLRETVSAKDFGAVGDGVADDTAALRSLISACGIGGLVRLAAGKTYSVSGGLGLLAGQTVYGYGASIKRCDQIASTTATNIQTGASSVQVTVANGALFSVGNAVTVYNGATYDPRAHTILEISGNVLTLGTSFTVAFPTGGTVITCGAIISAVAENVRVLGVEIHGNRANNTGLAKWETHVGIYISGGGTVVRDCYVHDEVSEAIELGGVGCIADNNIIMNCGGNGIHFTGSSGGKAHGNYIKNVNLLGTSPGHADGGITFSDSTEDSIITGNYVDTAICGVASIDYVGNSSVVISGNIIKNCSESAIEGRFPTATAGGKVSIIGNMIYDSKVVEINYTPSFNKSYGPSQWIISGNYLENTAIKIAKAFGICVTGNILKSAENTTSVMVDISDSQTVSVANNQITGGGYGIFSSGENVSVMKINGNTFTNQYMRAIYISGTVGRASSVEGNTIIVDGTYATNGYYGIVATNNCSVIGNIMDIQVTSGNSGILCPSGGASINGALVKGNIISSSGLTYSIRANGGSQNNVIINNMTQQAISNGGGAANTVVGNVTIF